MKIIVGRGRSKATQKIEITDPTVSREHCWLTDNGDGTFSLENKSPLGTFVNGRQIVKTRVTADSLIKLGPNAIFRVADLLPITNPTPPSPPEFSISYMYMVWEEYHRNILKLQEKQRNLNLLVRVPTLLTIGGGAISAIVPSELKPFTIAISVMALLVMVYGFYKSWKFNFALEKDLLDLNFQDKYICPNPECRHFLGNIPYNILKQDKYCRYCKCKFTNHETNYSM